MHIYLNEETVKELRKNDCDMQKLPYLHVVSCLRRINHTNLTVSSRPKLNIMLVNFCQI